MEDIRAIELYCGIGGFHYGVNKFNQSETESQTETTEKSSSKPPHIRIVKSFDYDFRCRKIYEHNFKNANYDCRKLENIKVEEFEAIQADLVFMSPPCQPFTRNGLKLDDQDARSASFFYLINQIFPKILPKFIILENVKGYETSRTHAKLVNFLETHEYEFKEFLLSPYQIGIPYQRYRYFMVACRKNEKIDLEKNLEAFPILLESLISVDSNQESDEPVAKKSKYEKPPTQPLKNFITPLEDYEVETYLPRSDHVEKYLDSLDLVDENSEKVLCFTATYGRYMKGTGSLFSSKPLPEIEKIRQYSQEKISRKLADYQLRFFTPTEILNFHGFDRKFEFPNFIGLKGKYQVCGNSLSADVIKLLLKFLFYSNNVENQK